MPIIIHRIRQCELAVDPAPWPVITAHKVAIRRHWQRARQANPMLHDGQVCMFKDWRLDLEASTFIGRCYLVPFSAFFHWHNNRGVDQDVRQIFGAGVVETADGGILIVQGATGTMNAGLYHLPGGFIDPSDVIVAASEGAIDIWSQIHREIREELGLSHAELGQRAGFCLSDDSHDREFGLCGIFQSPLTSNQLIETVHGLRGTVSTPHELSGLTTVQRRADLTNDPYAPYCRAVIESRLAR